MRPLLFLLPVLLPLTLTACSEDAGSVSSPSFDEEAIGQGLAAMYAGDHPDAEDREEGRCFAEELLGSTDPAALQQGGLVDERGRVAEVVPELDEALAEQVADAQLACTDFVADSTAAQVAVTKGGLDRSAYERCLRAGLSEDQIRAGVVASLRGAWEDPALTAITSAQDDCADQ